MVETQHFKWGECRLAFDRIGEGNTTLILLHGYGEDKSSFHALLQALGRQFTCLSIDLPFHGDTQWPENQPCSPEQLSDLLQALLLSESRASHPLALLGYSMGGRIALSLIQEGRLPVSQAWLLASDGFSEHPLYWIATHTRWGNHWFESVMKNPRPFLTWVDRLQQAGLIHSTKATLTHRYLEEASTRKALYQRWTALRRFRIQNKRLQEQVKKQNLRLMLIYGEKDKLISAAPGQRWSKKMPAHIELCWVAGGHRLLQTQYLDPLLHIILR